MSKEANIYLNYTIQACNAGVRTDCFNFYTVRHKKTGNIYTVINDNTICATNAYDGTRLVTYIRNEQMYSREYNEFIEKFERLEVVKTD
jgi:hypothetical protein